MVMVGAAWLAGLVLLVFQRLEIAAYRAGCRHGSEMELTSCLGRLSALAACRGTDLEQQLLKEPLSHVWQLRERWSDKKCHLPTLHAGCLTMAGAVW